MKAMARQVLEEWTVKGHLPKDWQDAASHLISTIRKKCGACPSPLPSRFVEGAHSSLSPQAATAEKSPKPSLMEELDRQQEERTREFEQRQRTAAKPADIIRSMGYDPSRVSLSQAMSPEWTAANPPTLNNPDKQ